MSPVMELSSVGHRAWPLTPVIRQFAMGLTAVVVAVLVFHQGLGQMVRWWFGREEYSHGILIPFIAAYLIWRRWNTLAEVVPRYRYVGAILAGVGVCFATAGELATLYQPIQYGFLLILYGITITILGLNGFRKISTGMLFLVFMLPLPEFFYRNLSAELQLVSSALGVAVIRLFGISVNLQGNVIDLGVFRLQVVDACSGLRYLFPLMSLGFLCAVLYRAPMWQRALVFLSSMPITVFMNSFRIGVIGVLVEYWGAQMAEGFLHDFEGWIVFMACTALLLAEIWVLNAVFGKGTPFRQVFGLDSAERPVSSTAFRGVPQRNPALIAALFIVVLFAGLAAGTGERTETVQPRAEFSRFPDRIGTWRGTVDVIDDQIVGILKFDDYLLSNYRGANGNDVNFYVAYYGSQCKGDSAHSPRTCIPGGGWKIVDIRNTVVESVNVGGVPLRVNRVLIEKGNQRQLVYYWFQQRGRIITNEFLVKWYLLWDGVIQNRTDGAMVRLVTSAENAEAVAAAEQRLQEFAATAVPLLEAYVPGKSPDVT
jgi:exosortase D (VPLPA-CTERM-specific)